MHSIYEILIVTLTISIHSCGASLWDEMEQIRDLSQFRNLCGQHSVAKAYLEDENARITVFAPVDQVFESNPTMQAMEQKQIVSHIVDVQVPEISRSRKWKKPTFIRSSVYPGNVFITQFENSPGNYSYFANNGKICNHVSNSWALVSGEQYLYKICSDIGQQAFPMTALDFVRDDTFAFDNQGYSNKQLTQIWDILERIPDVAIVIFGSSAWNGFHTFFLPSNEAFGKVPDRNRIDREVLLAHATGNNRVLFTQSWLYDGDIHSYPSVQFTSTVVEDNNKLKLTMRNITDRRTGRWQLYAVSEVYEEYSNFRRGSVWAKILVPNIPVQNGVVHIIDSVLGIVSNTIDQLLNENHQCRSLMQYINTMGQIIRSYFTSSSGMITFFAPLDEAFDRIPERVERRLLRDRLSLERILKLHIVPGRELTSDQINNNTIVNTVDPLRRLYFVEGEWPKNNITYYVVGGGVRAAVVQENVAATNGIVHYIDRVLGVPYQMMSNVIKNETSLQSTYEGLRNTNLRFTLDPWEVIRPEQNMTFFVPTNEAWERVPSQLKRSLYDGDHWKNLEFVYKRHIIQGQALMLTDLRERTYVMMNGDEVVLRRNGRYFELYWPDGNKIARIISGGEFAAINGFMHQIDNVLVQPQDLEEDEKEEEEEKGSKPDGPVSSSKMACANSECP